MVDDSAQLYTMEGIAAAFVILATIYLVAGTTSVYTPGDSHITDMQLEVLGNDALRVMDTPNTEGADSDLAADIAAWDNAAFSSTFGSLLNERTSGSDDTLQFSAQVSYRDDDDTGDVMTATLVDNAEQTGYEQAVRVTRLVDIAARPGGAPATMDDRQQVVLVEVLIWRG
ncbi:DUF7288 family protein [Methanofollis fontis]|uniref:Uncharacterized protein n=1 Tax=Methanofollis fontis TaxID=2052832 RepID=A0A483CRD8_9EURY|nr:hypothetical protein [Methanofollis fontis]TAJ45388.1 hypothetical protein CUJ86_01190 [Methanofollis fontis]